MVMKKEKGFTLVELMIVIGILVFLIMMVINIYRTQVLKGNDAKRKADLHKIQVAIEEYEKDHDCYPTTEMLNCNPGTGLQPYLSKIPCDPISNESYFILLPESVCPIWYIVFSNLENTKDKDIEKLGCQYGCGPDTSYNFYVSSPNAPKPAQGTPAPTPTSTSVENSELEGKYGCFEGTCLPLSTHGEYCEPYFENSSCLGMCLDQQGQPTNFCN